MCEQQGKRKNEELYEQRKGKELNNKMIYGGNTNDLSALLSHNLNAAITVLLQ